MYRCAVFLTALLLPAALLAQLQSGPPLPHQLVRDWAKLPRGWNLGQSTGVAIDKDDNVWVFNRGSHPVLKFDRNGNFLESWGEGLFTSPHGLRFDHWGKLWAVDVMGHAVMKLTAAGKLQIVLGGVVGNNDSKDSFNQPTNTAFAPNGDFYVSDGYKNARIIKFNRDGEYLTHWGRPGTGDGEFNLVHDVCLDSEGRVYVADRANQRVQIFDGNGKFLGKWTDAGAPWGLSYVAKENAIYMADGTNDRVVKLDLNGKVLGVLGSHGKIPGKFDLAHGIAVDSTGAIYVTEIKNWRVQKFESR